MMIIIQIIKHDAFMKDMWQTAQFTVRKSLSTILKGSKQTEKNKNSAVRQKRIKPSKTIIYQQRNVFCKKMYDICLYEMTAFLAAEERRRWCQRLTALWITRQVQCFHSSTTDCEFATYLLLLCFRVPHTVYVSRWSFHMHCYFNRIILCMLLEQWMLLT